MTGLVNGRLVKRGLAKRGLVKKVLDFFILKLVLINNFYLFTFNNRTVMLHFGLSIDCRLLFTKEE